MKLARVLRWVGMIGCAMALLVLLAFAWMWTRLGDSLPVLDGTLSSPGLTATTTIERDALGTVTIRANDPGDAAQALGFAHAQDRFFQMDLMRRRAAGELAELFGRRALRADQSAIVHRFRKLSGEAIAMLPAGQRQLLEAYTRGVNDGLGSLPQAPWEYAVLRTTPQAWQIEDCGLIFYSMVLELRKPTGRYERTVSTLRDVLGRKAVDFFNPLIGPHDSALDGTTAPLGPPPIPDLIDLRETTSVLDQAAVGDHAVPPGLGSNAIVIPGERTAHGGGLLAGDPHLGMKIPNTWYRACLEWPRTDGSPHQVTGVSLPGVPGIIIGTNGHIAWSFTNADVDVGDLVAVDLNQVAPELLYYWRTESVEFDEHIDVIRLKDGGTHEVTSTWTNYGPIVGRTIRGKPLAHRWIFHDPAALNFEMLHLNTARTVKEALGVAAQSGMPNQNMFVVDEHGQAAWTVTGKLPRRFGFDGRFPVAWTFGDRGWTGYLPPGDRPVVQAQDGRPLWSGNQRKLGGDALRLLGDNGYDDPDRGRQIETRLGQLPDRVEPADLLAIQLDDRGLWVEPWRELFLATMARAGLVPDDSERGQVIALIRSWSGHASAESVGYRLLRDWHHQVVRLTMEPIFARILRRDADFRYQRLRYHPALATLHREEPSHLLAPEFADWDDLRVTALDQMITHSRDQGESLTATTWGERNRLIMGHPFAAMVPAGLEQALSMPASPQAGDHRMPRVARPGHGASLRMIVSPGQEHEGILHLPGGQSGNPRSPFFRAGHAAWLAGEPSPLLPGDPQHWLTLSP